MPAEIDTGGHRVLHCDYRADCPTATPIQVSTPANNERRIDRVYSDRRGASTLVNVDRSSAKLSKIDENQLDERKSAPKDRRRRTEKHASKAEPSDCRGGNWPAGTDRRSSARISRIDDEETRVLTILNESDFPAKNRAPPRRNRRVDGFACLASSKKSFAIENASENERFSIARNSQEDASVRDKVERAESRLRDQTERSRLAITDASASPIARRRSLQDRSWTSSRPSFCGRKDFGAIDHTGRTRAARGASLLSSHHSHTRSKDGSCAEERSRNVSRRFCRGEFGNDDAWASENARIDYSERRDGQLEEQQTGRIDLANGKKAKCARRRVRSFLQLAILLFLVAFGRYGTLASTSVVKFSARSTASGLSVLGISAIIGAVSATPIDLTGDAGTRAERSANLSHITGASRKIRMYIKNRYLQILPDTTVNGSNDDTSDYTIFQRISVSRGQLRIQSVATCLYLCMDPCGLLYGSRETTEDCVFNETIEKHNYNTYSSVRWSTPNKTLYLGLNRYGQPKKIKAKGHNLGKLSANAQVLTQGVKSEHVEALQARMMGAKHGVRHGRHQNRNRHRQQGGDVASLCPTLPPQEKDGRDRFRCRKRKKRKKRKRRCRPGERPGPQCRIVEDFAANTTTEVVTDVDAFPEITSASSTTPESKRSCEGAASEEACRRQALSVPANKRKSRIDDDGGDGNLTINGKNKASTSNAKKPNVSVADSQSKKPDLTDGKKKKKKRKGPPQASKGSAMVPPSRKRYGPGMTSSPRGASSPLTAPASEASTTTSSSSPSPPGASTAPSSERRPDSPSSGRKKAPPSSSSNVARSAGSLRVGKSFPGSADSRSRSQSTPATPRNEIARPPSTTKVPETTSFFLRSSSVSPSSSLLWQESAEDCAGSLSDYSLVDESSSSTATSEFVTGTEVEFDASSEVIAEMTSFRLDEEDGGSGMADTIVPRTTTRFPLERLVM